MAQKAYSLSHTKWMCKYHIVFTPKYRRKVIYNQIRGDIGEILRKLCEYKGIEIIGGHLMPDHVHVLLAIPPKYSVASVMGYLKGKSSLMIFDRHANLKYKFGNRKFWAEGYYVSTVGLNEATIAKYIREQESHDIALDKLSVKEYEDPFKRRLSCRFDRRATGQDALGLDEVRARAFRREPGARGLYPKSKPPFLRVVLIKGFSLCGARSAPHQKPPTMRVGTTGFTKPPPRRTLAIVQAARNPSREGGDGVWPRRPTACRTRSGCASTTSCSRRSIGAKSSTTK